MRTARTLVSFWLLFGLAPAALPSDGTPPPLASAVEAFRLQGAVRLDGVLDESDWQRPSAAPLIQNDPDNGRLPRLRTDWWVAYDDEALYLAGRMHDAAPESIQCDLGRRDSWPNSDWLFINLDTFNDDRNGYTFSVNPAGVIRDGTLYNDGWDDMSWDGVWEQGVTIDDRGWAAEVRIPFSQLNFPEREEQTWGINVSRRIRRYRERDELFHSPRGESGYIGRFPDLVGIRGIRPVNRLEVLAYVAGRGEFLDIDEDHPFTDSSELEGDVGADFKWGLASNLTLNATINPDFGQVEVDPAVVNLSDFETFFPERRPFFVKDANVFRYGQEGTNNNWNFNWGDPMLFYSRRIGRAPSLSLPDHDYAETPDATTILAAGKLTGKTGRTSVGLISAVTAAEHADLDDGGARSRPVVEPRAVYNVLRAKRTSGNGNRGLGFIGTGTWRDLPDARSQDELTRHAIVGGVDGWTMLDEDATWAMRGYVSASHVRGSSGVIDDLQRSSCRYLQRPGVEHFDYDTTRTSLSGAVARLMLNKQSGAFRLNTAVGATTPGYEINDVGYQSRADNINAHLVGGWRQLEPGRLFREASLDLGAYRTWDYGGTPDAVGGAFFFHTTLTNYWCVWGNSFFSPPYKGLRFTRGGPAIGVPARWNAELYMDTDGRRPIYVWGGGGLSHDGDGSRSANGQVVLTLRPRSSLQFTLNPELSWSHDRWQWVSNVEDPEMTVTGGTRCIFGELEYRRFSLTTRVDWTFTPKLTLQAYVQPLLAAGTYTDLKELAAPGSRDYNHYGKDKGSTLDYDAEEGRFVIDPDGPGAAEAFTLSDPDFNFKSLKINMVLRWEHRPGSTIYLVWTQGRTSDDDPGSFKIDRDARTLFDAPSENIFMLKVTHWFDI